MLKNESMTISHLRIVKLGDVVRVRVLLFAVRSIRGVRLPIPPTHAQVNVGSCQIWFSSLPFLCLGSPAMSGMLLSLRAIGSGTMRLHRAASSAPLRLRPAIAVGCVLFLPFPFLFFFLFSFSSNHAVC